MDGQVGKWMMMNRWQVTGWVLNNVQARGRTLPALVVASKEIGLQANADKTKYRVTSRDQNAGRSHNIKIDNRSFERVEEFKYLGTTLTNQNSIQEEIKS